MVTSSEYAPSTPVSASATLSPGADALATAVAWLGWPALTVDVDLGGLGRSFVELAIVLEGMGRAAAPGAYLPTMTQFVPAVREVGTPAQAHRFLSAVAAGEVTGTLALHEGGRWDPDTVVATAQRDGDGWQCGGWRAEVSEGRAAVSGDGDVDDWWRAVAAALWDHLDRSGSAGDVSDMAAPEAGAGDRSR